MAVSVHLLSTLQLQLAAACISSLTFHWALSRGIQIWRCTLCSSACFSIEKDQLHAQMRLGVVIDAPLRRCLWRMLGETVAQGRRI